MYVKFLTATAVGVCALLGGYDSARAAVTSISVVSVSEIGSYNHNPYREATLRMVGTARGGAYDVPLKVAFPTDGRDHSGVAVVDVVNTVFQAYPFPLPAPARPEPLYLARVHLGDDYLFGSGHVYLGVNWDKDVLDSTGTGTIAAGTDAYAIIRDAAALARNPRSIPVRARPPASNRVVAYGFSQSGNLLRAFYRDHANSTGGLAFDGALYGGAEGYCSDTALGSFGVYPCGDGPVSDGGKVIAFSSETDAEWFGYSERGQTANYRMIEIAGTSHIPRPVVPFDDAPAQNPASWTPAIRASLHNLIAWIDGVPPPDSNYITLDDEVGDLFGAPFREAIRDTHGNALGGVRLPHMTAEFHGHEVGAPLGTYEPFDFNATDILLIIGGHFTPFDAPTLDVLYPSHDAYVTRVAGAARRLVERREILAEDRKTFIKEAAHSNIGK
jgi:alpha/beta hydrolase family protein